MAVDGPVECRDHPRQPEAEEDVHRVRARHVADGGVGGGVGHRGLEHLHNEFFGPQRILLRLKSSRYKHTLKHDAWRTRFRERRSAPDYEGSRREGTAAGSAPGAKAEEGVGERGAQRDSDRGDRVGHAEHAAEKGGDVADDRGDGADADERDDEGGLSAEEERGRDAREEQLPRQGEVVDRPVEARAARAREWCSPPFAQP